MGRTIQCQPDEIITVNEMINRDGNLVGESITVADA